MSHEHTHRPVPSSTRAAELLDVGRALTTELDLGVLLDRVLETARNLTGAQYAAIGVLDDRRRELAQFLTTGIDDEGRMLIGELPHGRGILGLLIEDPRPIRMHDVTSHPKSYGFPPGHPPMRTFLGTPIRIRGESWGNLYLTEKDGGGDFDDDDVQTVTVLAEWAAIAIDNARRVEAQRLRATIAAAEHERRRWARELHDETLQGLGALKLSLTAASRATDPERRTELLDQVLGGLDNEIGNLRAIIRDLRPAVLDELGLEAALRTLAERVSERGVIVKTELKLGEDRLNPELETAAYRVAQEALSNVVKHASATHAAISIARDEDRLRVTVEDDGVGFGGAEPGHEGGFGIVGMRERAELLGGTVALFSEPGRTVVELVLPLRVERL